MSKRKDKGLIIFLLKDTYTKDEVKDKLFTLADAMKNYDEYFLLEIRY